MAEPNDCRTRLERLKKGDLIDGSIYPELNRISWHVADKILSSELCLFLYERNWEYVDKASLSECERALIKALGARYGSALLDA